MILFSRLIFNQTEFRLVPNQKESRLINRLCHRHIKTLLDQNETLTLAGRTLALISAPSIKSSRALCSIIRHVLQTGFFSLTYMI